MPNTIKKGVFVYCPKSGRRIGINWPRKMRWFVFPVLGFLALLWILLRVIPKPSRANYPCVRAAAPLALSFLGYVLTLGLVAVFLRKAKTYVSKYKYLLALQCIAIAGFGLFIALHFSSDKSLGAIIPPGAPNMPIGTAKGIYPGGVVWVHDPNATFWQSSWNNQSSFFYWDSNHTDAEVVERMLSSSLCTLTGQPDCVQAWDSIFRYYNINHGKGNIGYQPGEKIVIKVNHNNQHSYTTYSNRWADTPPCVYLSLLTQLVYDAGITEDCITLTDSIRYIDNKTYQPCSAVFPNVQYVDSSGQGDRIRSTSISNLIHWSGIDEKTGNPIVSYPVAKSHFEADYIINLGRVQGHGFAGVSFAAKNWFGSIGIAPNTALHDMVRSPYQQSPGYQILVDLMGHQYLGGKTILYILDGLWGFRTNGKTDNPPTQYDYSPFNQDYPSSLFLSQDPVAIDSVAFDFYRAQYPVNDMQYLHEAALADNPPSGTFYDPEGDGVGMQSLGVHEHWNNPVDKQYSRNLGAGEGIELISVSAQSGNPPLYSVTVTATPTLISNTQTSQLLVDTSNANGPSPLSYTWILPGDAGSVSDSVIANPIYTPPPVTGTQIYTVTVQVSDGQDVVTATADITVSDGAFYAETATFNTNTDGYSYLDNTFLDATASAYASGSRIAAEGFTGGALQVLLGGIDDVSVLKIAGGWQKTFTLASPGNVQASFRYNMTQSPSYDTDESSDMMFSIDGMVIGSGVNDYLARLVGDGNGDLSLTTGWQLFTTTVSLPAGSHTIIIGGYNNKKSANNEMTTILIDDVTLMLTGVDPGVNAPPVINSVTATPASILHTETSQLMVDAGDTDGPSPLSYNWIVPDGTGSVSNTTIANPTYTPPVVAAIQTFIFTVEVSDGITTVSSTVDVTVTGNAPPVINSVTATPASILHTETSQLLVDAGDSDGPFQLSYNWIVPVGAGSVSNPTIANPTYTPPVVAATQTFIFTVEVSDGITTVSSTVDVIVTGNAPPVINSVTATPASILHTETSQLLVDAGDTDGPSPLSYNWIVPVGAGSVSNPTIANPTYTPPVVAAIQTFIFTVEVSDGITTVSSTVDVTVTGNAPPVINSVTATPASILHTETSQLLVDAGDSDGPLQLSYNWIVPVGAGSVSNPAIADPVYIPPFVDGTRMYTVTVQISDGQNIAAGTVNITVTGETFFSMSATFNTDTDGFSYLDNTFQGATASAYAGGSRIATGGFTGGALRILLGGIDNIMVIGMAGGWEKTFTLASSGNIQVSFQYNLTQFPSYDSDESSYMMFSIDGTVIGSGVNNYLARLVGNGNGGPSLTTGWQFFTTTVSLPAGSHTIIIGGYNNKKTSDNEMTTILIDDVTLTH